MLSSLEYRMNFVVEALALPLLSAFVECVFWMGIFQASGSKMIAGFDEANYLSYMLWAGFIGRSTWAYDFRMMEDINSGAINGFLVRPISFFEHYLSDFLGYKCLMLGTGLLVLIPIQLFFNPDLSFFRVAGALVLLMAYFVFTHVLSFCLSVLAFFFGRIQNLMVTKAFLLWVLSGDILPLNVYPSPYKEVLLALPFSCGVYMPIGYIVGRVDTPLLLQGLASVVLGTAVLGVVAKLLWTKALKTYSGTGA